MIQQKKEIKTQRSNEENRYYWGVVVCDIAQRQHWSGETAHEWIKITFGVESTSTLTTKEFEELMTVVRNHVLKFWMLEIALPNQ